MRPLFFAFLMFLIAMATVGCETPQYMPRRPAPISHIVFIKLSDPAEADALLAECDEKLAAIPGVLRYAAGKHLDTGRANVDGDYDAGLYIGFRSEADYAVYVSHPNHVLLVEKWRPRSQWMRVYDVYDPTP